ncbi:MAG TPA: Crp/Fnr family transcriptional regulator [Mobilitalea sp.]|nr:Crp/Fnr family transcriptional regulator [Mobilitalea sp.]
MFLLSDILSIVSDDDRQILLDMFENAPSFITENSVIKTLQPDQTLISTGQKADKIFIHITGNLSGVDTFEPDIIYNFIEFHPVNIIGEFEAFTNKRNYQINIIAKTKSVLIAITIKDFLNWMKYDITALNIITRLLALKLSSELKLNRGYLFLDSYSRLLLYIYNYCIKTESGEQTISIHKKRSELADELGFCEKTVNRSIHKLVSNGFITYGRNYIKISPKQLGLMKETLEERQLI